MSRQLPADQRGANPPTVRRKSTSLQGVEDVNLHDWRPDEEVGPDDPGKVDLRLTLRADQLLIDTPDGRQIMIELEGDQMTAHAYNDVSEGPASLRLRCGAPIKADATAHLSELYQDEEGPSP